MFQTDRGAGSSQTRSNVNSSNEKIPRKARHTYMQCCFESSQAASETSAAKAAQLYAWSAALLPLHWLRACSAYDLTRQQLQLRTHLPEIRNIWKWKCGFRALFPLNSLKKRCCPYRAFSPFVTQFSALAVLFTVTAYLVCNVCTCVWEQPIECVCTISNRPDK